MLKEKNIDPCDLLNFNKQVYIHFPCPVFPLRHHFDHQKKKRTTETVIIFKRETDREVKRQDKKKTTRGPPLP
jgi:hypothetical protein